MKRILAGTAASSGADAVARWASRLATEVGAELVLVRVVPEGGRCDPAPDGPARPDALRVRRLTVEGDVGPALLQAGDDEDADLVVVGSSRVGWYPAPHPAHVAHHLVCHATRAVAVVPDDIGDAPVGRLVVGLDESTGSRAATRWAANAPAALTQGLVAVHATSVPLPRVAAGGHAQPPADAGIPPSWIEAFRANNASFTFRSMEADPVVALCQVADEVAASTIVLGGRAGSGPQSLRIGSVGLRVLDRSRHPVIIVPCVT